MFGPYNIEGEPPIAGAVVNFDVVRNQEVQRWKISHFFQLPKLNFLLFFIISLTSDFAPSILFHLYFSLNRDWKLWIGFRGRSFFTMSLLDSTCWIGGSVISSVSFFFIPFWLRMLIFSTTEIFSLLFLQISIWGLRISMYAAIFLMGFQIHLHIDIYLCLSSNFSYGVWAASACIEFLIKIILWVI